MRKYVAKFNAIKAAEGWKGIFDRLRMICKRRFVRDFILWLWAISDREKIASYNDFFFNELGVSREATEELYAQVCAASGVEIIKNESRHRFFFTALKVSGFSPRNILEIGTEHGTTARFLVELFPEARVFTVNLPEDDPLFDFWHEESTNPDYVNKWHRELQERNLSHPRITVIRRNAMWLIEDDLPVFDFIWLDGGHWFPEAAWGHMYAMHCLSPGGWLFSDDVEIPPSFRKDPDPRFHVYYTISYYNQRIRNPYKFLLKRETPTMPLRHVKFVAYWKKTEDDVSWKNIRARDGTGPSARNTPNAIR